MTLDSAALPPAAYPGRHDRVSLASPNGDLRHLR